MKKYYISASRIKVTKHIYDKPIMHSIAGWFRTIVGVRQGCLLSPTLFNIFLDRIKTDTLEDQKGTVSTGGRIITNLHFGNDISGLAGEEKNWKN